ncbi:MAG: ribosome silencing factor [Firmicutes bacterium]|nr:ribosome silencing factor [Bacillota bacterium]
MVVEAAEEKKAQNVVILDLAGISLVADYFVICSGRSRIQVQAIAEHIEKELKAKGVNSLRREGYREARWILLDYGSVVVHIFREEDRSFYNLERLWSDAELIEFRSQQIFS